MFATMLVACSAVACGRRASDAELQGWSEEVNREEERRRATTTTDEVAQWTLAIRGNVDKADYAWPELLAMAKTHVITSSPSHTSDVKALVDYRGIRIGELLDNLHAKETDGPGGKELTVIAADGFISARPLDIVRRTPILLAVEQDGVLLVKKTGGPLLEVPPHTSHPETFKLLPEGGAFYVTTLIVGTEALAVKVGPKVLGKEEIDKLERHTVEGKVGFRFRWPSSATQVHGPRLRDVIGLGGLMLRPKDEILVRRKPRTETAAREVTKLQASDVFECDVLLGTRWGSDKALIPAGMGGPAVLAFPSSCPNASGGQAWPVFVESIEVVPKGDSR